MVQENPMITIVHNITMDNRFKDGKVIRRPYWIREGAGRVRYWTSGERFGSI